MVKIRSFLKWAGGKFNCINTVVYSLPSGNRLIEPFTGSGVVFMNTQYSSYILGESNPDLVQIFTTLKKEKEKFINYCREYFQPETNCADYYYKIRNNFNQLTDSYQKSAHFLYLNRHGYNGLCRYNSKGLFNVPFGNYIKPYFPQQEMQLFLQKSHEAQFIQNDFRESFKLAVPGDVIYCDPPYVPLKPQTRPFAYTKNRFTEVDQIELAELAKATASRGIPVIVSNHDTEFTRLHYNEAQITSFSVSRYINCNAYKRNPVKELIAVFT